MNITVIGTGFVGVVTAAVFASLGHQVVGLDIDESRVTQLQLGKLPFFEPELDSLVQQTATIGNLSFTTAYEEAIPSADFIFVCVGTPSSDTGAVDLRFVESALRSLAPHLSDDTIVIIKSTVPPGSFTRFEKLLKSQTSHAVALASIPEFLREGSAVQDTLHPSRIVIGADSVHVFEQLKALHVAFGAPILQVTPASAQMGKYAANAYLATRITFINQIADLCEKNGADIAEVIETIGYDERIGKHYWYPGLGYGGSCFPKDVKELAYFSRQVGHGDNWFNDMQQFNEQRISAALDRVVTKVGSVKNKQIAVLGLAFKPQTDDTRESPALKVMEWLLKSQATVTTYDPRAVLPSQFAHHQAINQVDTIRKACQGADGIMIVTEWPEIVNFDFTRVRDKTKMQWLFDTRNRLHPPSIQEAGYQYIGIGRVGKKV